ncbi:hypothetical protein T10_6075 [Trichinella papuae]|uniref:Uncharacterized protein n=1 Tax=Trichinella papuae TaxID=268474 RepID=A0A0V1MYH7_9BILA|nr:hypothetical protein T10_6075 [Trichinella papuae]
MVVTLAILLMANQQYVAVGINNCILTVRFEIMNVMMHRITRKKFLCYLLQSFNASAVVGAVVEILTLKAEIEINAVLFAASFSDDNALAYQIDSVEALNNCKFFRHSLERTVVKAFSVNNQLFHRIFHFIHILRFIDK